MECERLSLLLSFNWQSEEQQDEDITNHLRSCPLCQRGLIRLAHELEPRASLSCDECRLRLPDYYEATHPEYPLAEMPARAIVQVACHLSHCAACKQEYQELASLWRLEEREGID
jgi:hypothetical protein